MLNEIKDEIEMKGVREYGDELAVRLDIHKGRRVIVADTECGLRSTRVDLVDVLIWLKNNRPGIIQRAIGKEETCLDF